MRGSSDQGIGVGGQGVVDVISSQGYASAAPENWTDDIVHHFTVSTACEEKEEEKKRLKT